MWVLQSYRNRAASYNRWVRTYLRDVLSSENRLDPHCICLAVADYSVKLTGPPVEDALEDWPFDSHVLKLTTPFSRAGGFQHLLNKAITTPPDESLVR